ncbi:T9SS type A sorting domain-containing protein [Winogradskyella sp. SYSU M77433]|uniref:T9SS type A sorting domain-containing protein n=1 Tax=Winogradskyella sp. SYSU M77433 TaxID=3042722 RepID=UPI002480625A|nr:T9SS type A sorting domain-containing protein [Winogradskyella sp. SYSU M77433]MDH7911475.1 T9SS type A sorting domain-containing protein [Winogradskyella sp. SYSU M77433]
MKKSYFTLLFLLPSLIFSQVSITSGITPDLSLYGESTNYPGEGEYQIFLSSDNILDKPIILVDGFDPGDTRDITGIYDLLDFEGTSGTENLADLLRVEGFDIVILNFPTYVRTADGATIDGGADFIERNAMVLVELIDTINTAKASNSPEQNVIIGPSMGGIITRYALNYMENQTLDADTRLYISFDSPHHGANVPIGLQHQLNFLANNALSPVTELQPLINGFLKSSAARQLLVDHLEAHLSGVDAYTFDPALTLPEPHPFRSILENDINSLTASGFPENVRNVAIVNGSGIGSAYLAKDNITPVTNGFVIADTTIPVSSPIGTINVDIELNMTPSAGTPQQVSRFFAPLIPPVVPNLESTADSGTTNFDGVDSAPGGLFGLSALTGDPGTGSDIATDFINALQIDKFSFIPTVSALALEITNEASGDNIDWHHSINLASRGTTDLTPFDNTFLPDDNEYHLQLTENNVAFALSEILTPPLNISEINNHNFRLEKTVIENNLVLISDDYTDANITVIDITGNIVFSKTIALENRTDININVGKGMYIINLTSADNSVFTSKFFVN